MEYKLGPSMTFSKDQSRNQKPLDLRNAIVGSPKGAAGFRHCLLVTAPGSIQSQNQTSDDEQINDMACMTMERTKIVEKSSYKILHC